jgi:hypothetical protein
MGFFKTKAEREAAATAKKVEKEAAEAAAAAAATADPGKYKAWLDVFKTNISDLNTSCGKILKSFELKDTITDLDDLKKSKSIPEGLKNALIKKITGKERWDKFDKTPVGFLARPFFRLTPSSKTLKNVVTTAGMAVYDTIYASFALGVGVPGLATLGVGSLVSEGLERGVGQPLVNATTGVAAATARPTLAQKGFKMFRTQGGGKKTKKQKKKKTKKRKRKQNHKRTKKI